MSQSWYDIGAIADGTPLCDSMSKLWTGGRRMSTEIDPDEYVRENKETLVKIIKHGDDDFVRAMALTPL